MTAANPLGMGADVFTTSAQQVVDYLNQHTPIGDWSVSRVFEGEQVHVHVHHQDLLNKGMRLPWNDTLCRRMCDGAAHVVPDLTADTDYADHEQAGLVRSYAGFPITDADGSMFGVLCGLGVTALDDIADLDADLVKLMSTLLSNQLRVSRAADRYQRDAELAETLAQTDALTELVNRRGWDSFMRDAERRVNAYGDIVAIAIIDLDDLKPINDADGHAAGDATLKRTAEILTEVASDHDRLARYCGDEFAILSSSVSRTGIDDHFAEFMAALEAEGIAATIGYGYAEPGTELSVTFDQADRAMLDAKEAKRAQRAIQSTA